jgi:DNA polymerase III sliding clamp (beta) subunit (PCNA family)
MIEINKGTLVSVLESCALVAPARSPLDVVRKARLTIAGGELRYQATDLTQSLRGSVQCAGDADFLADPKGLLGSLGALTGESVRIAVKDRSIKINDGGKRRFQFTIMDPESYPELSALPGDWTALPDGFRDHIKSVAYAASHEHDRPGLAQVVVSAGEGIIQYDASDGKRVASFKSTFDGSFTFGIPLGALRSVLATEGPLEFSKTEQEIFFRAGHETISTKRVEAAVIPVGHLDKEELPVAFTVNREQLIESVSAVARVAPELLLTLENDAVCFATRSEDGSESKDAIGAYRTGEQSRIGLNANYLLEAARAASTEELSVAFALSPEDFAPVRVVSGDLRAHIMPLQLAAVRAAD